MDVEGTWKGQRYHAYFVRPHLAGVHVSGRGAPEAPGARVVLAVLLQAAQVIIEVHQVHGRRATPALSS